MSDKTVERNPIEQVAAAFLESYRRGERPSLTEYSQRYPELAEEIRDLFPALVMMEELGPQEAGSSGALAGKVTADGRALERLGDYRILREVGRGGMGLVYEAEQESLGRHVALKVLPFQSAKDVLHVKRFRREARAAARLHHTNIVPVFEVGEYQGILYYAMQFIQGQGLDEVLFELRRLRAGKLSPCPPAVVSTASPRPRPCGNLTLSLANGLLTGQFREAELDAPEGVGAPLAAEQVSQAAAKSSGSNATALPGSAAGPTSGILSSQSEFSTESDFHFYRSVARVGVQVAEALAYAHDQKVLHRDIKPSNLLLDIKGTVWVTDFGLAKEEGDNLTRTGDIVGTLRYMAPERFQGWSDARSDIYGLGITLYELLTLQPAFQESDRARLIEQITQEEPPRPRKLDRRVPRDLETVLLKATAKEPAHRYATAAELANDLRRFLDDKPIYARRTSLVEHAWRWCRRNRALAALSSSVAVLSLLLVSGWIVANLLRKERDTAVADRQRAERAEEQARTLLHRAQNAEQALQIQSRLAQARAQRWSGQVGQRFKSLKLLQEAARLNPAPALRLELRDEAIACMALPDLQLLQKRRVDPKVAFDFAADLELYVESNATGKISIRRFGDDSELLQLPGFGVKCGLLRLSPDSRFLVALYFTFPPTTGECRVWDLTRRLVVQQMRIDPRGVNLDFCADGSWLAIGETDQAVHLYELPSCREWKRFPCKIRPQGVYIQPKSNPLLAVSSDDRREVELWDVKAGKVVQSLMHPGRVHALAWSADGKFLAVAWSSHADSLWQVWVWDAEHNLRRAVLKGHLGEVVGVSFNRAGDLLATRSHDGTTSLWDPISGKRSVSMAGSGYRFDREGRRLAFCNYSEAAIWEVASGQECRTLLGHRGGKGPRSVAVSRDGRLMASASDDGVVLWDVRRRWPLAHLAIGPSEAVLFHPRDGSLITSGSHGLYRWPLSADMAGRILRLGKPEMLNRSGSVPGARGPQACLTPDGRLLAAVAGASEVFLKDLESHTPKRFAVRPGVTANTLSPDGKWLATKTALSEEIGIWDTSSGRCVRQSLGDSRHSPVTFSPDGKWLVTSGAEDYSLWRVDSWQREQSLERSPLAAMPAAAFSRDGKLLAIAYSQQAIRLIDPESWNVLATLETPEPRYFRALCFSPDGGQLTAASENHVIQVWDLRLLRKQLGEMALDWEPRLDLPALPADDAPRPWRVSGVAEAVFSVATRHYSDEIAAHPQDASACNNLAWQYATGPAQVRDVARALPLAQRAVARAPKEGTYWHTLGVVYYRLGQWQKALETLQQAARLQPGGATAFESFFLAMTYQRLGQGEKARECYDQAMEWWLRQGSLWLQWEDELQTFRAEAAELLGRAI